MIRLHVIAEGQTEQRFFHEALKAHLATYEVYADVRCVVTSKDKRNNKTYKGGLTSYIKARNDILDWIKEDKGPECRFTVMFDLYALPEDFPSFAQCSKHQDPYDRVTCLEQAMAKDIGDWRFIPYIQLHEFETLILADPEKLRSEYLNHEDAIARLIAMVGTQNPELINHGRQTAPSKRIIQEIPEYEHDKTSGASIAALIGLETLRAKCRHFDEWLMTLEGLRGKTP